jgi:hypothetical protein
MPSRSDVRNTAATLPSPVPGPREESPVQARPYERAMLSLFLPGLGQFAQRRFVAGTVQLGTAVAYTVAAMAFGGVQALWISIGWSVWSVVDAYRHDRP